MLVHSAILSATASIALLSGSATALVQARATDGIDVESACNLFYGTSFSAKAIGSGCNDWRCVRGNEAYGLDFNEHCQNVWGGRAYASCSNGVFSWVCNH